jgi:hypothetical protein
MRYDRTQDTRPDVSPETGRTVNGAVPPQDPKRLRRSRLNRERTEKSLAIALLVFGFPLSYVGGKSWPKIWPPVSSHGPQALAGNLEATPEVRNATRGEWTEVSGQWSEFGVLGAAFDGEEIVFNSAESERGSLGCWISPRGQPLHGHCHESRNPGKSNLGAGRTCSWRLVVYEISPTRMHGARVLKSEGSDPGCTQDYGSLPSSFTWERPSGPRARQD